MQQGRHQLVPTSVRRWQGGPVTNANDLMKPANDGDKIIGRSRRSTAMYRRWDSVRKKAKDNTKKLDKVKSHMIRDDLTRAETLLSMLSEMGAYYNVNNSEDLERYKRTVRDLEDKQRRERGLSSSLEYQLRIARQAVTRITNQMSSNKSAFFEKLKTFIRAYQIRERTKLVKQDKHHNLIYFSNGLVLTYAMAALSRNHTTVSVEEPWPERPFTRDEILRNQRFKALAHAHGIKVII